MRRALQSSDASVHLLVLTQWHHHTHSIALCSPVSCSALHGHYVSVSDQLVSNICCVSLTPARNTVWSKMCHEVMYTTSDAWQRSVLRIWFLDNPPWCFFFLFSLANQTLKCSSWRHLDSFYSHFILTAVFDHPLLRTISVPTEEETQAPSHLSENLAYYCKSVRCF